MDGTDTLETQKKQRLLDNFFDDIFPLRKYLDDPGITDIFVTGSGEIIVKIFGKGKVFSGDFMSPSRVRGIILSAANLLDKPLDPIGGIPKLEAVIPKPLSARLTGLLPPWVAAPELTIRKPPKEIFPLEDYVAKGRLKTEEYDLICRVIRERKNILVGGGTGSGKSTFTNAVLKKMVEYTPNDRFYIVEDVPELQCEARDKTQVEVNPKHAAEAVRTALRWTPDRIIFGEVRYGEVANELLKAWNTGHTGNITTVHADSCSSMLVRMEDLLREEIKGTIPPVSFTAFANTFDLKQFKENKNRLASYCPWSLFVGDPRNGIVLLKPGALMRCYSFICPDLGSASADSINSVSFAFNEAVKSLGSGWALQFEARRSLSDEYPGASWSNPAGYLIDRRRQEIFSRTESHFVNYYVLTLTHNLKSGIYAKTGSLLYKQQQEEGEGYLNREECRKEIRQFESDTDACISRLTPYMIVEPLDAHGCATYLHASVSTQFHPLTVPARPIFLDHFITDVDLDIGTTIKLGDRYIPLIAVRDFPLHTYPNIFSAFNESGIEYRWSTRWIGMDKIEASKEIERYQKRFYGSRKSMGQMVFESAANIESGREDPAATAFETDTNEAKVELATDEYSFGYYTSTVMVWDADYPAALEKAAAIAGLINGAGFTAKIETVNAFNAFLSMQPGNVYANVRRPLLSSGNLSHIIPLSSVWSGMAHNHWTHECFACSAPLLVCSTQAKIAFFLNLNVGDVGHTFIFGPSGAGKSTLLCLLESQFLKYRGANVIILDKDKSARSITMAAGGVYVEPGGEAIAFQPLRDLEAETDLSWAAEFIKLLLESQKVTVNAVMSDAITAALRQIRDEKSPGRRTLSTFQQYVNYTNPHTGVNDIRTGIQPYTINGEYGRIFDADQTNLALSKWVMIEMGTLMKMGAAAVTPALMFLFHFIERIYTRPDGNPTGDPTLLILDEAWVFLDNDYFSRKIEEWLVTLRKKKRVFCVFATQEVAKAANSRLRTTIVSQCLTKIYLADPSARTDIVAGYYRLFGLEDNEITAVSRARMKRDYLYKSTQGTRMFELSLDPFQLALLSPDHSLLDELEEHSGRNTGKPLAAEILRHKGFTPYEL